jgi:hypothetical protein
LIPQQLAEQQLSEQRATQAVKLAGLVVGQLWIEEGFAFGCLRIARRY